MSDDAGPEQPARRYPRTTTGLIGSMVAVVVVVIGFVIFRATFREQTEYEPEDIDYLEAVTAAQGAGQRVVYPRSLPSDWVANSVTYNPAGRLRWGIGMLTGTEEFVGIAQQDESLDDLLATYVDEETDQGADHETSASVSTTWQTWSDEGGDHAYSAEIDGAVVLVYGSADEDVQEQLIDSLTREPLTRRPVS